MKAMGIFIIIIVSLLVVLSVLLVVLLVRSRRRPSLSVLSRPDVVRLVLSSVRSDLTSSRLTVEDVKVRTTDGGLVYSFKVYDDWVGPRGGAHKDYKGKREERFLAIDFLSPSWPSRKLFMIADACAKMRTVPDRAFLLAENENPLFFDMGNREKEANRLMLWSWKPIFKPISKLLRKKADRKNIEIAKIKANVSLLKKMREGNAETLRAMIGEKERERREALKEGKSYPLSEFFVMMPEEDRIRGVYVLTDAKSGKSCVGQSRDIRKRITKQHFLEEDGAIVCKNADFKEDFEEDGIENWNVPIIESQSDLNLLERETIRKLDSAGSGYNKTIGNID
jgi:hypothetical protein